MSGVEHKSHAALRYDQAKLHLEVKDELHIFEASAAYTKDRATLTVVTTDHWRKIIPKNYGFWVAGSYAVMFGLAGTDRARIADKTTGCRQI